MNGQNVFVSQPKNPVYENVLKNCFYETLTTLFLQPSYWIWFNSPKLENCCKG